MAELSQGLASWQAAAAVIVFVLCYALVVMERWNRALVVWSGALLMVFAGIVDLQEAYRGLIEWRTIFLLAGMMVLVGVMNRTGIFQYIAVCTVQKTNGRAPVILLCFMLLSAVGSAFLDNVTTIMLLVPLTLQITRMLRIAPAPFFIAEIVASNIGGMATLVGTPTNMMIGSYAGLTFNDFLLHLGPLSVIIFVLTCVALQAGFRRQLVVSRVLLSDLLMLKPQRYIRDRRLLVRSLVVFGLTLAGFLLQQLLHVEAAAVALAGAALMVWVGVKNEEVEEELFGSIEWVTVFFIAGLYVLAGGLAEAGAVRLLAAKLLELAQGNVHSAMMLTLWVSAIASATMDNIPYTAAMIPVIHEVGRSLPGIQSLWWSLAAGTAIGGNGTLIGSAAGVVAAGMAVKAGNELRYVHFLKVGVPVALLSLLIAMGYFYLFMPTIE